jgi:magnesium chelatase family protein
VKTENFKVDDNYDEAENSASIKTRVEKARSIQLTRFKDTKITFNSEMSTKEINKFCKLDEKGNTILKQAVANLNLSARSYFRILKLARTIADLE